MTELTHTPIWDAPGPTDNYQCWSTYLELAGGRGPSIGLSVEKDATEYPDEPYRFDATACEFFFVQGGRPTLMEAQRVVRGAVIVHLEALLAQARALEPQHAEPPSPSEPIHWPNQPIRWTGPHRTVCDGQRWTVELPWCVTLDVTRYPRKGPASDYFTYEIKCGEGDIASGVKDDRSAAHKAARDTLRAFAQSISAAADRIQIPEDQ